MTFQYAGTVSGATMDTAVLVSRFMGVLRLLDRERASKIEADYPQTFERLAEIGAGADPEAENWLLGSLFTALDECAPEGYRFGAHEGDGADFGFWRTDDDDNDVTFGTLTPEGRTTNVRTISSSAISACPHTILMPEHYREDGTCRCDDPNHTDMQQWGYTWANGRWS